MKRARIVLMLAIVALLALSGCGVLGWFLGIGGSGGDADAAGDYVQQLADIATLDDTRHQATQAARKKIAYARVMLRNGDTKEVGAALETACLLVLALEQTRPPRNDVSMDEAALVALEKRVRKEAPKLEAAKEHARVLAMACFTGKGESKLWGYVKFLIPVLLFMLTVVGSVVAGIKGTKSAATAVAAVGGALIVIYLFAAYSVYIITLVVVAMLMGAGYMVFNYVQTARHDQKVKREQEETIRKVQDARVALPPGARTTFDAYASNGMSKETERAIRDVKDGLGI